MTTKRPASKPKRSAAKRTVISKPKQSTVIEVVDDFGLTDNDATSWQVGKSMTVRCNATSKTTGEQCKQPAVKGNAKCRFHGGKSPRGIASPQFKHGRYSNHIPSRLADRYTEAVNDPELLNIRHEIALVEARITDLLTRVDTGEAGTAWKQAEDINSKIQKAVHNTDYGELMILSLKLDRVIGDARTDVESWAQIQSFIEQRRKLVESEQKRLVAGQQMLTAEQAMTFAASLLSVVREHVSDRKALAAIAADMQKLTMVSAQ